MNFSAAQLRIRAIRLQVAKIEPNFKFDSDLHREMCAARDALQRAEELTAARLLEREEPKTLA